MAGTVIQVPFTDVSLSDGAFKTACAAKAGTNQMVKVRAVRLGGEGGSGDALPLGFRLQRITADSGTGTAITPKLTNNALSLTPRTTARHTFTAEPTATAGEEFSVDKFHPQGGWADKYTFDDLWIAPGTELALQVKTVAGQTLTKVSGHLELEE